MDVISRISVDLTRPNMGQRVNAIRGDGNTRRVEISLTAGGARWEPPAGVEAAIAYRTKSGAKGCYNLLADGSPAITFEGNKAMVTLISQMLTAPGSVSAALVFNDAELNVLTSFPFEVYVTANPAEGAPVVEDYVRLKWLEDKLQALKDSGVFHGAPGAEGPQGPAGPQGPEGPPGPQGIPGTVRFDELTQEQIELLRGPRGEQGEVGPEGPQGKQGQQGEQGEPGPAGVNGRDGQDGADGAPGMDGADGKSAYELAVANGFSGSEAQWLESLRGADGAIGPVGPPGPEGKTPVYGVDYGTPEEIAGIAQQAADVLAPEINQIKSDLSNKLPKSPSDWEAWTAEEQATARERLHGSFGKIIDVTLEEDVTAGITFAYDAVGNEINAQDICIDVYLPVDYTKNGVNFKVVLFIDNKYIESFSSFNADGSLSRWLRYMMFSIGELRIPVHGTPTTNLGYVNGYPANIASSFSVIPGSVSKILIELYGGMLPAGSKIEIYAR